MNERIKELIEECTDRHFSDCSGGFETFDKEKFAELLIRECADIAGSIGEHGYLAADEMFETFGIQDD